MVNLGTIVDDAVNTPYKFYDRTLDSIDNGVNRLSESTGVLVRSWGDVTKEGIDETGKTVRGLGDNAEGSVGSISDSLSTIGLAVGIPLSVLILAGVGYAVYKDRNGEFDKYIQKM